MRTILALLAALLLCCTAQAQRIITKGATDQTVYIKVIDSATGALETGVTSATSGIDLEYTRNGAAPANLTESDLAAVDSAHSDGGMKHIGGGIYRVDLPDAAVATGVSSVYVGGTITDMIVVGCEVQLTGLDFQDGTPPADVTTWNGTAVATPTVAGVPEVDVTHWIGTAAATPTTAGVPEVDVTFAAGTAWGSGAITAGSIATGAIDATALAANAIATGTIQDNAITAAAIAADAIGSSEMAVDAIGASELATDAIGSAEVAASALAAGTEITGLLTTGDITTGVWNAAAASYGGAGTYGQAVEDILDDTGTSGVQIPSGEIVAATFGSGAIDATAIAANAIGSSEIATGAIDSTALAANAIAIGTIEDNAITSGAIAADAIGSSEISADAIDAASTSTDFLTEINGEVLDVLNVDTFAEPGQGTPAATTSLAAKINYLYKFARNKKDASSSEVKYYNDDATTVDHKASVNTSGGTTTVGETATGP